MAARCFSQRKASGWDINRQFEIAEVRRLAHRAVELGPDDPVALATAGVALAFVAGELEAGDALIEKGLELNPNLAWAWLYSGWVKAWSGEADTAISHITRAMQLSPHDPNLFSMRRAIAFAHFIAGRYQEALSAADIVMKSPQNAFIAMATVAASAALLGRQQDAESAFSQLRASEPTLRLANLRERFPIKRDEDFARWAEGLRRAGLPE
jgi:tetratricopeptide (TPR) repeat protein